MDLVINPENESRGVCDCCGSESKTIWGYVRSSNQTVAAYYVQWTVGSANHYPNIDLIVGSWGEGATPKRRILISLRYRPANGGGSFMVIDSESRPANNPSLCGRALKRVEVIGTPLAKEAFDLVDALWAQDLRLIEVQGLDKEA